MPDLFMLKSGCNQCEVRGLGRESWDFFRTLVSKIHTEKVKVLGSHNICTILFCNFLFEKVPVVLKLTLDLVLISSHVFQVCICISISKNGLVSEKNYFIFFHFQGEGGPDPKVENSTIGGRGGSGRITFHFIFLGGSKWPKINFRHRNFFMYRGDLLSGLLKLQCSKRHTKVTNPCQGQYCACCGQIWHLRRERYNKQFYHFMKILEC